MASPPTDIDSIAAAAFAAAAGPSNKKFAWSEKSDLALMEEVSKAVAHIIVRGEVEKRWSKVLAEMQIRQHNISSYRSCQTRYKQLLAKAQVHASADDAEGEGKNEKPMSDDAEKIQQLCEDFIIEQQLEAKKKTKVDEEKENVIKGAALSDNSAITRVVLGEVSRVGGKKVSLG